MHRFALVAGALVGTAVLGAQSPPGPPVAIRADVATAEPAAQSPARARTDLGIEALAGGDRRTAVSHFLAALEIHPASPAILRNLLRCVADDADARALWSLSLALASTDARGGVHADRADRELVLPKDDVPKDVANAQAMAIVELARFASKLDGKGAGAGVVARWAADLALDLGRDTPAVLAANAEALNAALGASRPDHATVFAGLRKLLEARVTTTGTDAEADAVAQTVAIDRGMRAARVLRGLAAQVGFGKDLQGPPPPDLGSLPAVAGEALERLRARVEQRIGEPWTVAELTALGEAERQEFTARHATWADPGVAVSPTGLYTIWTTCGFETLLGAATTIEEHHRRLVDWFGSDPFRDRPGTVRIEPESDGLESNGAPFWWAGGFQGGDVTTLRFAWSSIDALGTGLTHELTHRFDATLHPFGPAWLVEGRAVWTARSYGRIADTSFVENFLAPHSIQDPFVKGYGRTGKLQQLLDGTIDDYRDNYSAGYALFAYLKSWQGDDGKPVFVEPLQRFTKNARAGRADPVAYFTSHFADGAAGRPDGLEDFAAGFGEFLHQCYRWSWGKEERDAANAWIATRYQLSLRREDRGGLVMDAPTFSWARARAEPWFGQAQALAAGRVLAEAGDAKAAAAAFCWSLQVDGWRAENAVACAVQLEAIGARDAAWAVRREAARRIASIDLPDGEAPMLGRLSRVRALLKALRDASATHAAAGRPLAAAALAERHDRLARDCGAKPLGSIAAVDRESAYPRIENPHALGVFGWIEDGLTGYEDRRAAGLWFESEQGDVHVGRERPRDATGSVDRNAVQRDAFVRSIEWLAPGRYVVRARVHFTTSFTSGALVFGWTRRDRNLRLGFRAGDFLYAIGRKEDDAKSKSVSVYLDALWERDGPLPGTRPSTDVEFAQPSSFVDLELRVDGARVECFVMGERRFSYTTPDLSPIEGSIGFAMGQGAVRVQTPTAQRLDRGRLDDASATPRDIEELIQHPLDGVPTNPVGTLVLWVPPDDDVDYLVDEVGRTLRRLRKSIDDTVHLPQPWVVMLPRGLPDPVRERIDLVLRESWPAGVPVVGHVRERPPERDVWVLFVDAKGVLRAAGTAEAALPEAVGTWARRYRPPVDGG